MTQNQGRHLQMHFSISSWLGRSYLKFRTSREKYDCSTLRYESIFSSHCLSFLFYMWRYIFEFKIYLILRAKHWTKYSNFHGKTALLSIDDIIKTLLFPSLFIYLLINYILLHNAMSWKGRKYLWEVQMTTLAGESVHHTLWIKQH